MDGILDTIKGFLMPILETILGLIGVDASSLPF